MGIGKMARTIEDISHLDLENLSDEHLRELQSRIREIINRRVQSRLDEYRLMAREAGYQLSLFKLGEEPERRRGERGRQDQRRGPLPAKYRNPDNPAEIWSGRGIPPRWLRELMEQTGKPKEDFLVTPT
jgi:DNA-binding protein H-NS